MIEIFVVALLILLLAMIGMALGLLTGRHEFAKGCMTLGTAGNESECQICGRAAGGNGCAGRAPQAPPEEGST